jgi:hypothetical protein
MNKQHSRSKLLLASLILFVFLIFGTPQMITADPGDDPTPTPSVTPPGGGASGNSHGDPGTIDPT